MNSGLRAQWESALQNQALGQYIVGDCLGEGAFSLVFDALDPEARSVALKVLLPGSPVRDKQDFEREAVLLKILTNSSGVVDIVDTHEVNIALELNGISVPVPLQFHVLEQASGNLEELIVDSRRAQLSWEERLAIWRGAILGVHQMHLKRLVHRDLKSSNCLLFVRRKDSTSSKVSDLGRARDLSQPAQHEADAYLLGFGDLRFAAPEFLYIQGEDSEMNHLAADLYGLGALLFELATGLGLTQFALGNGPAIINQSLANFRNGSCIDLSTLKPQYAQAVEVLRSDVPPAISQPTSDLFRQLCEPEPSDRFPKSRFGPKRNPSEGLNWLLNRVDILTKILRTQAKHPARVRRIAS